MRNNSKAAAKRTQVVMSEKSKIFVSKKTVKTKSGKKITVNVYKANKNAKPIKTILHPLPPPTDRNVSEGAATMGAITSAHVLSAYQIERNQKRTADREVARSRPKLIISGYKPFIGSIRSTFTGPNRNNIV